MRLHRERRVLRPLQQLTLDATAATPSPPEALQRETYSFTPTEAGAIRVCAYVAETQSVTPLASAATTVAVRLPGAAVDTISASADPTQNEAVSVTIAGSSEADRSLYLFRHPGSTACGSTASAEYYGLYSSSLNAYGGDAVTAGTFSKTYSFTPTEAGTIHICAYVAESQSASPLGSADLAIAVRRPAASVSVALPTYLAGDSVTLTAGGSTEHGGAFAYTVSPGENECQSASYGLSKTPLGPGAFGVPVNATFTAEATHTFCLYLFDEDGRLLTTSRQIARKRGLEIPALQEPALANRRPTFTWATSAGARDTLVLSEDGEPFLNVTRDGGLAPAEDGEEEVSDVDDYYNDDERDDDAAKADPSLGKIVDRPDGTSAVELGFALPPGRYSWQVVRTRDAGERAASPAKTLRVSGPALTRLEVSTRGRQGRTSTNPGYTTLKIRTTPYVHRSPDAAPQRTRAELHLALGRGQRRLAADRVELQDPRPRDVPLHRRGRGRSGHRPPPVRQLQDRQPRALRRPAGGGTTRRRAPPRRRPPAGRRRRAARSLSAARPHQALHQQLLRRRRDSRQGRALVGQRRDVPCPWGGFMNVPI